MSEEVGDKIAMGLELLDAEAPSKNILIQMDPSDPRRRTYTVPTLDRRRQVVQAMVVPDSLFQERLELVSIAARELPVDASLLVGLLAIAKDFRHVRLCVFEPNRPQLAVVSSIVPYEIHKHTGPRLLHALREVAAVADSLENQITGADEE
jgi:hypothetical protein